MKYTLLTFILLTFSMDALELRNYKITIEVSSTKRNTKSWDIAGGAPDIYLNVDGEKLRFTQKCRDSYRCKDIEFFSDKDTFYIEVYDRDIVSDDLVGKGECMVGSSCILGNATVDISKETHTYIEKKLVIIPSHLQ